MQKLDGQTGFTLIELMVTLAMIVIVLAVGIPAFQSLQQNSNRAARINELVAAIQLARSEAVKRGTSISIIPATNWQNGWTIFTDPDEDRTLDAGETTIRTAAITSPAYTLTSAAYANGITFDSEGAPQATGSFQFSQNSVTRTITINTTGRPRIL
ncbi:MAG TPA: prepilin-type N-terminal cleavage/methylation domain-containing protein [Chromatiales bacterium]|nr:prepilin-type N-terminal cleavage/methylation domain-containing protein [Chromatiales bacterium]